MELMVKPYKLPEVIEANFDELKAGIQERARQYEMSLYSEDQIKLAKADRASLNKLKKALNDERIRMEKEYMIPFTEFKSRINEIISIIDKPIAAIDTQIKDYEEKQKNEKEVAIRQYMSSYVLPYDIPINMIWNPKWLLSTISLKAAYAEVDAKVEQVAEDLETLEALEEYQAEAIRWYSETLDLRGALNYIRQLKDQKAAAERIEQERKNKQEQKQPEIMPDMKPEQEPPKKPESQWIKFEALLTVEQAKALKAFFEYHKIEYKAI